MKYSHGLLLCAAASVDRRADQIPHPIERTSEQTAVSAADIMKTAQSSQATLGNQVQSGVMLGKRSGESYPGE